MTDITLKVAARDLLPALEHALACVDHKPSRPVLNGAHFLMRDRRLIVEASDGYRLVRTELAAELFGSEPDSLDYIIAQDAKVWGSGQGDKLDACLPFLRKAAKDDGAYITITLGEATATMAIVATTFTFGRMVGSFPRCDQFIPIDHDGASKFAVNARLMGEVLAVAGKHAPSGIVRVLPPESPSQPIRLTWSADDWSATAVIMPMFATW